MHGFDATFGRESGLLTIIGCGDVERATETVEAIDQQQAELDAQFQAEVDAIENTLDLAAEALETVELRPTKANISVKLVALAWAPHERDETGQLRPVF